MATPRVEKLPTSKVIIALLSLIKELDDVILNFVPEAKGLWQEDLLLIAEARVRAGRLEKGGD